VADDELVTDFKAHIGGGDLLGDQNPLDILAHGHGINADPVAKLKKRASTIALKLQDPLARAVVIQAVAGVDFQKCGIFAQGPVLNLMVFAIGQNLFLALFGQFQLRLQLF
jgi:hypothetical protein